jgi:hypothetical protein
LLRKSYLENDEEKLAVTNFVGYFPPPPIPMGIPNGFYTHRSKTRILFTDYRFFQVKTYVTTKTNKSFLFLF